MGMEWTKERLLAQELSHGEEREAASAERQCLLRVKGRLGSQAVLGGPGTIPFQLGLVFSRQMHFIHLCFIFNNKRL